MVDEIVLEDPEEEPEVFETLEDAVAALGFLPVPGPNVADEDVPLGEEVEPEDE